MQVKFKRSISFFIFMIMAIYLTPVLAASTQSQSFPPGTQEVFITTDPAINTKPLKKIAPLVEKSIKLGYYPGAVIYAGQNDRIIYKGVFGSRRILPNIAPMQFNTIFDLASLTKVVATAPAIMQLVERGKISLDTPVAHYWPVFAKNGKEQVTVRQLLTHTSGLPAALPRRSNQNKAIALTQIEKLTLKNRPGKTFLYSDVNFIILAYLVEKISGESFANYVGQNIYQPLGMNSTSFLPSPGLKDNIAPTELVDGQLRWGQVHDPSAFTLAGIAGNAGLFSNAHDLAIFAQMMLNHGLISKDSKQLQSILKPETVKQMIVPYTPSTIKTKRGLGFDLAVSSGDQKTLTVIYSYGHTGWTGTYLWIDPTTQSWLIILTSRTHPKPKKTNKLIQDRKSIAAMIASSL